MPLGRFFPCSVYFDYPLEQGLRRITHILLAILYSILIIH